MCTRTTLQEVRYAAASRATETTITEPGPDVSVFNHWRAAHWQAARQFIPVPSPSGSLLWRVGRRAISESKPRILPLFSLYCNGLVDPQSSKANKKARHPLRRSYKSIRSSYEERLR